MLPFAESVWWEFGCWP